MSAFWSRGRDISAENENAAAAGTLARSWRLTAVDRCDRCGAQAYVRVLLPGGLDLLFCAHHNRQYSSALADIAVEIQDETMRLACYALFGIRVIPIPESLPGLGAPAAQLGRRLDVPVLATSAEALPRCGTDFSPGQLFHVQHLR